MSATGDLLPPEACDTHMHFYDHRFAAADNALLFPPDVSPADYREVQKQLGCRRVVVVQPTTYGLDNTLQLEAMRAFGAEARGVMAINSSVTDRALEEMNAAGVRGARFHMLPGGAVPWSELGPVANRIAPLGWHIQLQMNGRSLPAHLDGLLSLPTALVIDHVGRFMPPVGIGEPGYMALTTLLETGSCWVKLSAPYESSMLGPPHYEDVAALVRDLSQHASHRMLWATNWPHPGQATSPSSTDLLDLLYAWVPDEGHRLEMLVGNPAELYGY